MTTQLLSGLIRNRRPDVFSGFPPFSVARLITLHNAIAAHFPAEKDITTVKVNGSIVSRPGRSFNAFCETARGFIAVMPRCAHAPRAEDRLTGSATSAPRLAVSGSSRLAPAAPDPEGAQRLFHLRPCLHSFPASAPSSSRCPAMLSSSSARNMANSAQHTQIRYRSAKLVH